MLKNMFIRFFQKKLILGLLVIQILSISCNQGEDITDVLPVTKLSLIPLPQSVMYGSSNIALPQEITISQNFSDFLYELLEETLTEELEIESVQKVSNENAFISINTNNTLEEEGYSISITEENINIEYNTSQGLLWAVQTLRQILLQHTITDSNLKTIPLITLSDTPQNTWRGFHIDLARHMFTIDYLKKITDILSYYKINKLQLHLTDDQGWRIEIKKYPTLTTLGGWREFNNHDKKCIELSNSDYDYTLDSRFVRDGSEYGGYYTQEELKGLIEYATQRGVEIIPEIDMPGHFSAAINVYPELSCTGQAGWGDEFSYPLCASRAENYSFLKDIIDEVADLFPSEYIHIGADEVEKNNWKTCERCQQLIQEQNLKNVDGLQNYFVGQMADYIKSKGKKVMAWDDAFISSDPQELLYTYWRDWLPDTPGQITQQGYSLVFMEWGRFYLSATPSDALLKSLYEFTLEPDFQGIDKSKILGFQACVWTELIPNERKFGRHVFPSLQAFAELAWGSERDWYNFTERLPWHLVWITQNGIYSRTPDFIN